MPRRSDEDDNPVIDLLQGRPAEVVQGEFRSEAIARAVARELTAAYPDRVVVVVADERVLVRLIA